MRHNGDVVGTLTLASTGGRQQFGESAVRYGRSLASLAAVAIYRAQALEQERRARSEAEKAVRTRDAVVSIVSHDLRNPLSAIMGSAEILLELIKPGNGLDRERKHLDGVQHAANTMKHLIRDLLDVTRLESGPLPIHPVRTNVAEMVDGVLEMFHATLLDHHLTLERIMPGGLPDVACDRERMAQALSNLLGNAVKFTPSGGHISVGAMTHERGVKIWVRDSGAGIAADQLPHLFDRFWQATRNDHRGLGLGLSIVKGIIDAHGGSAEVDSAPGKGTMIALIVPLAAHAAISASSNDGRQRKIA